MRIEFPVNGAHANVISDCFANDSPILGRISQPHIEIAPEGEDMGSLTWEDASISSIAMLVAELERGIPEYEEHGDGFAVQATKEMIAKFREFI